jgi:hypothetical protein
MGTQVYGLSLKLSKVETLPFTLSYKNFYTTIIFGDYSYMIFVLSYNKNKYDCEFVSFCVSKMLLKEFEFFLFFLFQINIFGCFQIF